MKSFLLALAFLATVCHSMSLSSNTTALAVELQSLSITADVEISAIANISGGKLTQTLNDTIGDALNATTTAEPVNTEIGVDVEVHLKDSDKVLFANSTLSDKQKQEKNLMLQNDSASKSSLDHLTGVP